MDDVMMELLKNLMLNDILIISKDKQKLNWLLAFISQLVNYDPPPIIATKQNERTDELERINKDQK